MHSYRYPLMEVNLGSLANNMNVIRNAVDPRCKIMGVVKANAYGHGALPVARVLARNGVSMLGVASVTEGTELRRAGIDIPILVFSEIPHPAIVPALDADLTFTAHSDGFLRNVSREAEKLNKSANIHIKVDTGMGRLGFSPDEAFETITRFSGEPTLALSGIFTHFASSETPDDPYAKTQINTFLKLLEKLIRTGIHIPIAHAANSAGIFNYRESHLDMVRPGISLYGVSPGPKDHGKLGLEELLTWKTEFVQIKKVPRNTKLSYNSTFTTTRQSLVGTIRIGYADGYSRMFSNKARVLVRGKHVPVVGTVCMDLSLVDLTELPEVDINDEVVLLGSQGKEKITSTILADLCDAIPYEIFCGIGGRTLYQYKNEAEPLRQI